MSRIKKSPELRSAEIAATVLLRERDALALRLAEMKQDVFRKDMIIDDIHRCEKEHIADLEKAKARIDELEMQNTKVRLDETMCGWSLAQKEIQLQRALGWIDHADRAPLGLSRVNPAPTEEDPADDV